MSESSGRFVTAASDPTGALVTTVGYRTVRERPADHRGLPSPFITFIVSLDEPVVLAEGAVERQLEIVVGGLHTEPAMVRMPRVQSGLQAAVHPLSARRLFGMPAAELARMSVEGEDVLGAAAPLLRERLAEAPGWEERFAILAAELGLGGGRPSARLPGFRTTAPGGDAGPRTEVVEAWRLLTLSRGRIRIGELADRVFLSRRRLSTLFTAEFGITPKEAARTMRFTHAVTRIGAGVRGRTLDLAALAAECGYSDQSHLDREFRSFAGISPSGWIAEEFPNIQAGGHRYAREWEP